MGEPAAVPDAVPVRDRLRVMQLVRACMVALVLLCVAVLPQSLEPGLADAVVTTLGYAVLVLACELVSRTRLARPLVVFRGLLLLDGLWLAWTGYLTGGLASPLLYAVLLHVAAVALLASYRTGLKLALWHSLLTVIVYNAETGLVLNNTDPDPATRAQRLAIFVVVLWLAAVSTSALSAINERELRRRRADLEALTDLAEQLERTDGPGAVAQALLACVVDTFGFARGLVLASPDGLLPLLASVGLTGDMPPAGRDGPSAVISRAHELRRTVLVEGLDTATDPWLSALLPGARNLVVVPMSAEGRALGAVVLEQGRHALSLWGPRSATRIPRRVISAVERSTGYAALTLRNAWLLDQVRRLAATDGLTRIANRRTFEATLEREVGRATRGDERLSLVMLDIDHFKVLNDTYGHQAGDEVLRNVAAALATECRDFDTPARYGGEEFAVVLPGCGPDEALVIAERLRRSLAGAPAAGPITASAGVASFPAHARDAETLVRAADEALYRSKSGGRDRTSLGVRAPHGMQAHAVVPPAGGHPVVRDGAGGLVEDGILPRGADFDLA